VRVPRGQFGRQEEAGRAEERRGAPRRDEHSDKKETASKDSPQGLKSISERITRATEKASKEEAGLCGRPDRAQSSRPDSMRSCSITCLDSSTCYVENFKVSVSTS